jgi:hypothetical protein
MPIHAMIDLETLGTSTDAVVLTIGGVKFDPNTMSPTYDEFYYRIEVDEQLNNGRSVDPDTLDWWAKQDPTVMEEALGDGNRTPVDTVLDALRKWMAGVDCLWAHGVAFDVVLMETLYKDYDKPHPWPFWKVKDSRTLFGILPKDPRKTKTFEAHNALEDAKIQALCVQEAIQYLNLEIR